MKELSKPCISAALKTRNSIEGVALTGFAR